jgi:hypothetical protein
LAKGKKNITICLQIFFTWNFTKLGNLKTIQADKETADDVATLVNPKWINNAVKKQLLTFTVKSAVHQGVVYSLEAGCKTGCKTAHSALY